MPAYQSGEYTRDVPPLPGQEDMAHGGNVMPRFFHRYNKNQKTGEMVEAEMVEILIAGDSKNAPVQKVTDAHRARWPRHYEAFKAQQTFVGQGTPIEAWGAVDASTARSLRAMNVMTVEQLAEISDSATGNMMGGRTLRDKARQYVAIQSGSVETNKMVAELAERDQKIALLERQVSELATTAQRLQERQGSENKSLTEAADALSRAADAGEPAPEPERIAARLAATEERQPQKRGPGRPRKK